MIHALWLLMVAGASSLTGEVSNLVGMYHCTGVQGRTTSHFTTKTTSTDLGFELRLALLLKMGHRPTLR